MPPKVPRPRDARAWRRIARQSGLSTGGRNLEKFGPEAVARAAARRALALHHEPLRARGLRDVLVGCADRRAVQKKLRARGRRARAAPLGRRLAAHHRLMLIGTSSNPAGWRRRLRVAHTPCPPARSESIAPRRPQSSIQWIDAPSRCISGTRCGAAGARPALAKP